MPHRHVAGRVWVHLRRAVRHVGCRLQRVVFDQHGLCRVHGLRLGIGNDAGYGLPRMAHDVGRQHRTERDGQPLADPVDHRKIAQPGAVLAGQHADHAGHGQRLGHVDRDHHGVRVWRPHEHRVSRPIEPLIRRVAPYATQFPHPLGFRLRHCHPIHAPILSPERRSAGQPYSANAGAGASLPIASRLRRRGSIPSVATVTISTANSPIIIVSTPTTP